jgi:Zn-dependent metalloprotease
MFVPVVLPAQGQPPIRQPGLVTVTATTAAELRNWDTAIDRMVRANQLIVTDVRPDPHIDGRTHETLAQYHQGVPVYGGSIARQAAGGVTISIFGMLYEGIVIDVAPALSVAGLELALAEASAGARMIRADTPRLIIYPSLDGGYQLAYETTMSDARTYIVDADSGTVVRTIDEMHTQGQIGVGTGALGDSKKLSTTQVAGAFRTHDQLRPAPVRTFDTRGSDVALIRLQTPPATATDADFAVDGDNTWNDPPVVDTHAHVGWMEDYLFKQQSGWAGVDNRRGTITAVVHSGLINNAFFMPPPFGPEGRGMFVYGRTPAGVPLTTLDIVSHEMMHGVTDAAMRQRTGIGVTQPLFYDGFGPTTMTLAGTTFSCATHVVLIGNVRYPMLCDAGRYVLISNHAGALHEGFSDVFGHAAEFFHQPAGTGTLRADYKSGEDVAGLGPLRASDVPQSLSILSSGGPIPYPDHVRNMFSYPVAIVAGTRENPLSWAFLALRFTGRGDEAVVVPGDGGGVHLNSTVLSHAYYLAIEGGRNATSGMTVQGVGAANRAQIDRAFFRGITVLLPNGPSMQVAAQVILQGAVDLHGANSAAATAIRQAMQAVGLM